MFNRRSLLAMASITAATDLLGGTAVTGLQRSPKMPVVFVGHGSPMNVLDANRWRTAWEELGQQFGPNGRWPKPQLILCISAHWITRGWAVTGMEHPKTIHDFGGFPRALFDMQYPAPGSPAVAKTLAERLVQPHNQQAVQVDEHQWGLDHGAWSVLKPMFPLADIPVIQLSMDYSRPPSEHLAMGQQLAHLREQGVLIVGSGNTVHNLGAMARNAQDDQAYDWTLEFDARTAHHIDQFDHTGLANFLEWGNIARMAHPTHDHMLPLLYTAGAATAGEPLQHFNVGYQLGSVAMRSVVWG